MACIESFNLFLSGAGNLPSTSGFDSWTIGGQNFWSLDSTNTPSTFITQGFKNINIYSIELCGDVSTDNLPSGFQCLVNNWSVTLQVKGTNSAIQGIFGSNGFNLSTQPINPTFKLSKYLPKINFVSPIVSATEIVLLGLKADGIGNESLVSAQLNLNLSLTIYYSYEGED